MRIVILTKSSKKKHDGTVGYCVAGYNLWENKNYFARLVADDSGESLSDSELVSDNGQIVQPLDLIEVSVERNTPKKNQTENFPVTKPINIHIIEHRTIDYIKSLFDDGRFKHSDFFGDNKPYLTEEDGGGIGYSLTAVKVSDLTIKKNESNKSKANFNWNGHRISNISVTDPIYYSLPEYKINNAILIVSIPSECFGKDNLYYKFVAKVFEIRRNDLSIPSEPRGIAPA